MSEICPICECSIDRAKHYIKEKGFFVYHYYCYKWNDPIVECISLKGTESDKEE